jgi:hypothetical protein
MAPGAGENASDSEAKTPPARRTHRCRKMRRPAEPPRNRNAHKHPAGRSTRRRPRTYSQSVGPQFEFIRMLCSRLETDTIQNSRLAVNTVARVSIPSVLSHDNGQCCEFSMPQKQPSLWEPMLQNNGQHDTGRPVPLGNFCTQTQWGVIPPTSRALRSRPAWCGRAGFQPAASGTSSRLRS